MLKRRKQIYNGRIFLDQFLNTKRCNQLLNIRPVSLHKPPVVFLVIKLQNPELTFDDYKFLGKAIIVQGNIVDIPP